MWFKDSSLISRLQAVFGLSFIGAIVSGYALAHHFGEGEGWCDVNTVLNCDIVNRGPYSEIAGIPVALIGLVAYAALGVIAVIALRRAHEREELWKLIKGGIAVSFLFSLYLTYIEAFVLVVYCPVCLISLVVVIAMTVVVFAPRRAFE